MEGALPLGGPCEAEKGPQAHRSLVPSTSFSCFDLHSCGTFEYFPELLKILRTAWFYFCHRILKRCLFIGTANLSCKPIIQNKAHFYIFIYTSHVCSSQKNQTIKTRGQKQAEIKSLQSLLLKDKFLLNQGCPSRFLKTPASCRIFTF